MIDENISRAAGAAHGQRMGVDELRAIVEPLGRPLVQRTTLYATGMTTLTSRVRTAVDELVEGVELSRQQRDLVVSMFETVVGLARTDSDTLDLKIVDTALQEMAEAFEVFRPWRDVRKVTMFGSARTAPDDPIYVLARDLARQLATEGWMIVTGAGPGIMAAGTEGAGRDRRFGVNIRLPHEQGANAFIAQDPKLVEMRYFFTRKLMLIKESHAYVVLPAGFGTLDECFELLTLLQTGKAEPAPVVLVETPGGGFWHAWLRFVEEEVVAARLRVGARPRVLPDRDERRRGVRRDPALLPQLPLRALGGRPAGAAPRAAPRRRRARGSSPSEFADILVSGRIRADQAAAAGALRRGPPRPRARRAAVRQGQLRATPRADRRAQRVLRPSRRRARDARPGQQLAIEPAQERRRPSRAIDARA